MRMTFEEIANTIQDAVDAEMIYNVAFNDLKFVTNNMLYNTEIDAIRAEFMHSGKWEDLTTLEYDLIDSLNASITQLPSKKTLKMLKNVEDGAVMIAVTEFLTKWTPVADNFKAAKAFIVKGRQPSNNPNAAPARTLENTGTCSCCGRNVKLAKGGDIVAHGYTIQYGWQSNNCFGVGYLPIEVSDEGLVAYVNYLLESLERAGKTLAGLKSGRIVPAPAKKGHRTVTVEMAIYQTEREIDQIAMIASERTTEVKNWKPGTLPG